MGSTVCVLRKRSMYSGRSRTPNLRQRLRMPAISAVVGVFARVEAECERVDGFEQLIADPLEEGSVAHHLDVRGDAAGARGVDERADVVVSSGSPPTNRSRCTQ